MPFGSFSQSFNNNDFHQPHVLEVVIFSYMLSHVTVAAKIRHYVIVVGDDESTFCEGRETIGSKMASV